jgi:hypothetical protein
MTKPHLAESTDFKKKEKATEIYANLRRMAPVTRGDIKNYVKVYLDVDVPDKRICKGHNSPMEYLCHSYFSDTAAERPTNGDAIVWANRGSGRRNWQQLRLCWTAFLSRGTRCGF